MTMLYEIRCKKKPIVVSAVRIQDILNAFHDDRIRFSSEGFPLWVTEAVCTGKIRAEGTNGLWISTLEGKMWGEVSSYLINGSEGEIWAIKKSIFENTYEVIS